MHHLFQYIFIIHVINNNHIAIYHKVRYHATIYLFLAKNIIR